MNHGTGRPPLEIARERVIEGEIHDALVSTHILALIVGLRARMGDELMSEATGASVAALDDWCDGWLELPRDAESRLLLIDATFATFDDHEVDERESLVWFTTPNRSLAGRTPAATLAIGEPTGVAPALLVAARASIAAPR